jgi:4-hydroxyphenylpyruvate dioxygenase
MDLLGIQGIGGSHLYFVDQFKGNGHDGSGSIYDRDFEWLSSVDSQPQGAGLYYIDHLTYNVAIWIVVLGFMSNYSGSRK